MRKIFYRQGYHFLAYILLGSSLYFLYTNWFQAQNKVWLISVGGWIILSWIFAGIFQAWIVLNWRLELHYTAISSRFGKAGFTLFRIGFITLGSMRFLSLIPISFLSSDPASIPEYISLSYIVITTPLILWTFYSVHFYFGINRVFGADHFDPNYRNSSLEKRGTFKYIPNSMYVLGLLLIYYPGFVCNSPLGLITAVGHHMMVWTHYFCTEKPDIQYIYGHKSNQ